MKKIILVLAIMSTLLLACNSNSSKKKNTKNENGQEAASELINFHNNALSLYKNYDEHYISEVREYLDKAEEFVLKVENNEIAIKPSHPTFFSISSNQTSLKIPSTFGDKVNEVEKQLNTIKKSAENTRTFCDDLTTYINAEDYKDDNGRKLQILKNKISEETKLFKLSGENLFSIITPIVTKAEEKLLEEHPLKENILSSKKLLTLIDDFTTEVVTEVENNIYDETKLQTQYNAIESQLNINKNIPVNKKANDKRSNFNNFNKRATSFLGAARKLLRTANKNRAFNNRDYLDLKSEYRQLITAYNNFVR